MHYSCASFNMTKCEVVPFAAKLGMGIESGLLLVLAGELNYNLFEFLLDFINLYICLQNISEM